MPERSGIDYSQELPRIQTEKVWKKLFILFHFFMGTTFNGCYFSDRSCDRYDPSNGGGVLAVLFPYPRRLLFQALPRLRQNGPI